jgi:hypothetical protein
MKSPKLKENDAVFYLEQKRLWVVTSVFQNTVSGPWMYRIREEYVPGFALVNRKHEFVKQALEQDEFNKTYKTAILKNGSYNVADVLSLADTLFG